MASADRGTKRQCLHCGTKYYDLNRDPILCPACGKPYEPPAEIKPRKSPTEDESADKPAPGETEEVIVDPAVAAAGAEVVSFEDADAEETEDEDTGEDIPDVEDVEDIGGEVDNAFVEGDDDDEDASMGLGVSTAKTNE